MNQLDTEQVKKEKFLFLALCSEKDRQYISGNANLTICDFERITYLLYALGLKNYLLSFEFEHEDLMAELAQQILDNMESPKKIETGKMILEIDDWLRDFCDGLPSSVMRYYFEMLFDLDKSD